MKYEYAVNAVSFMLHQSAYRKPGRAMVAILVPLVISAK